jgi:NAD(P)-dependent dehydrogenase (short-subunit alcohol dehydrogenase family)
VNVKNMNMNGKRALVTGGAVRIGRAITEALLAEGDRFVNFRWNATSGRVSFCGEQAKRARRSRSTYQKAICRTTSGSAGTVL